MIRGRHAMRGYGAASRRQKKFTTERHGNSRTGSYSINPEIRI